MDREPRTKTRAGIRRQLTSYRTKKQKEETTAALAGKKEQ